MFSKLSLMFGILMIPTNSFSEDLSFASIRHLGDQFYDAAPGIEDFQSYTSRLDLDDDWEDLEEEFQDRAKEIATLEAVPIDSLALGKRFAIQRKLLNLVDDQISYLIYKRNYEFKRSYERWLVELEDTKPLLKDETLKILKLKGLDIARLMAVNYKTFEPEETQYALIKYYVLNNNQNYAFYFRKFANKFPKSQRMAETIHLAGEAEFASGNYERATKYFQEALAIKDSTLRSFTAFKLAWSEILRSKTLKFKESQNALHKAQLAFKLSFKLNQEKSTDKVNFPLQELVVQDLAWLWAEAKTPSQDIQKFYQDNKKSATLQQHYLYYRVIAEAKARNFGAMNENLANLFKLSTEARSLPMYFIKGIEFNMKAEQISQLPELFKRFWDMTNKDSDWYSEWDDNKNLVSLAGQQLAYYLKGYAIEIHQKAEQIANNAKNRKKAAQERELALARSHYQVCMQMYQSYYQWFPERNETEEVVFNLANIYLGEQNFGEAIKYFRIVAQGKNQSLSFNSAYNAVIAAYSQVQASAAPSLPEPGKALQAIPLPQPHQQLVEQVDFLVKRFPAAAESYSSLYTVGQIFYDFGNYPEAFKRFKFLATKVPGTSEGENAMRTILSFYWDRKEWKTVVEITSQLMGEPSVMEAGHEKFLQETLNYGQSQLAISKNQP